MEEKQSGVENDDLREEVRPAATRFVKQISLYANNKYNNGAQMTATLALMVVERILLNVSLQVGVRGSEKGRKFIETVYDAAKKDALKEWGQTGPSDVDKS